MQNSVAQIFKSWHDAKLFCSRCIETKNLELFCQGCFNAFLFRCTDDGSDNDDDDGGDGDDDNDDDDDDNDNFDEPKHIIISFLVSIPVLEVFLLILSYKLNLFEYLYDSFL